MVTCVLLLMSCFAIRVTKGPHTPAGSIRISLKAWQQQLWVVSPG